MERLSRRSFARRTLAAALAALGLPRKARASDHFAPPEIIDCAFDLSSVEGLLPELKRRGVTTAFRYYATKNQPEIGLPDKIVTPAEARALFAHGMTLGVVFQYYNTEIESMTAARGRADAETALAYGGGVIGQPRGSAIYFGVDGGWYRREHLDAVAAYFSAVREVFAAAGDTYLVGAYGSGRILRILKEAGLAERFWLALSRGWPDTPAFYDSGDWTMYQFSHHMEAMGRALDGNLVNPDRPDAGDFGAEGAAGARDPAKARRLLGQLRFPLGAQTEVFVGPGEEFGLRQTLTRAYNPMVIDAGPDWHAVSVDGTARALGFVRAADLAGPERMPPP